MSPKIQKEYDADIIGFLLHIPTKYFEELKGAISTIKTIRRVSAHKIDKLAPTNDCKSNGKKATKKRKLLTCSSW
jgi:hypothetical protein